MKAVVHIGMPKAGSTTIQEFLRLNASALEAQGVLYRRYRPSEVLQSEYLMLSASVTGRLLSDPMRRRRYRMGSKAELDAEAAGIRRWFEGQLRDSKAHTWIVSSEMLTAALHHVDSIEAVQAFFSEHFEAVRYIVYLRRQDQWLVSDYSQLLRNGGTDTFEHFVAQASARNYLMLIRKWIKAVGRERLTIRLLEPNALKDGDLIADFCEAAGLNVQDFARPKRLNESFTQPGARFVRRANIVVGAVFSQETIPSRALRKVARVVAQYLLNGGDKLKLSEAQRTAILAKFEQTNEAVRREFFPDRPALFEGV